MARFVDECWAFELEGLRGYVRGDGHHGVELTAGPDQEPVTRVMNLNLEHYVAADREFGRFVPRERAPVSAGRPEPAAVRIRIGPTERWPVRTALSIRLLDEPERTVEAAYEFTFEGSIRGFEAFVSNYCHDGRPPILLTPDGRVRPDLAPDEHRFWLPAERDSQRVLERYPSPFMGLETTVADEHLDRPVFASSVPDVNRRVVRAVDPAGLASVSGEQPYPTRSRLTPFAP